MFDDCLSDLHSNVPMPHFLATLCTGEGRNADAGVLPSHRKRAVSEMVRCLPRPCLDVTVLARVSEVRVNNSAFTANRMEARQAGECK